MVAGFFLSLKTSTTSLVKCHSKHFKIKMERTGLRDIQEQFNRRLGNGVADYYNTGAGSESTLRDNMAAFRRYRLKPALLPPERFIDEEHIDVSTNLLGERVSCPIGIAPTGHHR